MPSSLRWYGTATSPHRAWNDYNSTLRRGRDLRHRANGTSSARGRAIPSPQRPHHLFQRNGGTFVLDLGNGSRAVLDGDGKLEAIAFALQERGFDHQLGAYLARPEVIDHDPAANRDLPGRQQILHQPAARHFR